MSMRGHYRKFPLGSKAQKLEQEAKKGEDEEFSGVGGSRGKGDEQGGENQRKTHGKMEKGEEKRDFNIISFKMSNREITANLKKK